MILLCYGTRPEYIKILPLMDEFDDNGTQYKVLFTGQHMDLLPLEATRRLDHALDIKDGENRLDSIIESVMNAPRVWEEEYEFLLVQGDTTTAFACALAAFHRNIPVIHLEAGLRTYDNQNPYPEEFNRQAISRLGAVHLCPTNQDAQNLRTERVQGNIYVVGNTVLDNLRKKNLSVGYSNKVLITMHRRENHNIIPEWFEQFDRVAKAFDELEFVYYAHPNPNVQKHLDKLQHVTVLPALLYDDFIKEVATCQFVITDSGGLQEESSFLRKKSIVCRKKTERVAGLGEYSALCLYPEQLYAIVNEVSKNYRVSEESICPYGNGYSARNILTILENFENEQGV